MSFQRICSLLAARRLFNAGQSVSAIAKQSGKSVSTIRRWLKETA